MKVEITYKYNNDTTSITGFVRNWDNWSRKIKDGRIVPSFAANVFVSDEWNGLAHSIQDVFYETFSFDLLGTEKELQELNVIQSADLISVIQYNSDTNGNVISQTYTVDRTKSEELIISEPEYLGNTSGYSCKITFKTEKTIVNKGASVDDTNNITVNSIPYYTDFDVLDWNKDQPDLNVAWDDGSAKLFQTTNKPGKQILLYFTTTELTAFLTNLKASDASTINATTIQEIEHEKIQIGIDYWKVILKGVTSTVINNISLNSGQLYKLVIVDHAAATHTFYTDFAPKLTNSAPVISPFNNDGGVNVPARSITKETKKVTFYYNETNAFELKKRFELGGTSIKFGLTASYPGVDEVEQWQAVVVPEQIGVDVFKVEIDLLISTTQSP